MFSKRKFRECVLIGHGEINSEATFQVPEGCCILLYSPENYTLSNSAIEAIARLRQTCDFKSMEDVERFARNVQESLLHAQVECYAEGAWIPHHYLFQLADRKGVGSYDHKAQFVRAVESFKRQGAGLQDQHSLTRGGKVEQNQDGSVRLEDISKHYATRSVEEDGLILIHWLACRRDRVHAFASGSTVAPQYSVSKKMKK